MRAMPHAPAWLQAFRPLNFTLLQTEETVVHEINEAHRQFCTHIHTVHLNREFSHSHPM